MLIKINNIKRKLHKKLETEELDSKDVLKISQELDQLIVEYIRENCINEKEIKDKRV